MNQHTGSPADSDPIDAIVAGDWRQAAKLITLIERGDVDSTPLLRALYRAGGRSHVVGVTGAPGSGKSTLVNQLVAVYRQAGKRVAVLAIDPSSPFSGGAILGDRVRMQRHAADDKVFIRSMSSRGALGGLAKAAGDAVTVLDAMGWDVVIVETVGVGQNEIDIVRYAATVVLVETPSSGDAVQAVKAGVTEIGDVFVVNKCDQPGADRRAQALMDMLHNSATKQGWSPPVLKTDSVAGHGLADLVDAIGGHGHFLDTHPAARKHRLIQSVTHQMLWINHEWMARRLWQAPRAVLSDGDIEDLFQRRTDPYELASRLSRP